MLRFLDRFRHDIKTAWNDLQLFYFSRSRWHLLRGRRAADGLKHLTLNAALLLIHTACG